MEIQHVSSEDRSKAITIAFVVAVLTALTIYVSRMRDWVLIVELSAVLFVLIVGAIVYDYFVIR